MKTRSIYSISIATALMTFGGIALADTPGAQPAQPSQQNPAAPTTTNPTMAPTPVPQQPAPVVVTPPENPNPVVIVPPEPAPTPVIVVPPPAEPQGEAIPVPERETVIVPTYTMWNDPTYQSGIGIGFEIGGGVGGFTDSSMRAQLDNSVNGNWTARATIGTRIPLGLDINYVGSAADINALVGSQQGRLIGTTFEGAVRLNAAPHMRLNPYAFAGAGWQHYDVNNVDFQLSDAGMNDGDNLLVIPMGAGIQYRDAGFMFDVHGTFRAATGADLVLENANGNQDNFVPMHTWEALAALGYEF